MAVQFFTIPDPQLKTTFPKVLITGAAVKAVKGAAASVILGEVEAEDPVSRSYLGTPVLDNLEIPAGSYTDLEDNTIEFSGITVDAVLFEVNKTRNIVKTPIQGRDGTVKEYISEGDYQIRCNGMISQAENAIPQSELQILREIFEVPQQISIISLFLNEIFDIFDIVVERWNIPQVAGKRNEIPFSFTAVSDVPLDLEELE
jgi:hypothetical protein